MSARYPDKKDQLDIEKLVRGAGDAYASRVSLWLAVDQYEEALKFIDEEPKTLGEKILLMQMVGDKYRESGNTKKSDEIYGKMFELVDALAELVAKHETSGNRYSSDIKDDRHGWLGASLAKTYSHPLVKKRRDRGDFVGAVSLAKALYGKHVPEVEILYIARGYANNGDYAGAMEVGGNDAGRFGSDAGIRGYVAHAMFKKGEKAEAEKLLADTLAEIESGRMAMHGDFIVGLMLCGKTDEALRFKTTPVEIDAHEREQTAEEQSQQLLTLLLRCLLVSDDETRAMQLVDEWPSDKGKARGIWTLIHWNQEEHIDKETDTLLTSEWKKKWTAFFENYADTLEQKELPPSVHAGELNMAAECLINLDAKDAALKVLDKALEMDRIPDPNPHYFNATHTPMETGRLFFKLGEREKGTTAFTLAVQACPAAKEDYRKAESLKYVLEGYTEAIVEANPELIRNWPGYKERHGYNTPLKELWERYLFSSYPIM